MTSILTPTRATLLVAALPVLAACPAKPTDTTPSSNPETQSTVGSEPSPSPRFVQRSAENPAFVVAQLPPSWRLVPVESGATPLWFGLGVAIQREGLFLGDELLVPASDGRLLDNAIDHHTVLALAERVELLAPALRLEAETCGEVWDGHVNLYLDPDTEFADLVDTMYTLGRAGFSDYQLAVASHDAAGLVSLGVPLSPPKFVVLREGEEAPPKPEALGVFVGVEALLVARRVDGKMNIVAELAWDDATMAKLAEHVEHAAATLDFKGGPATAVFSADNTMSVAPLITAMALTRAHFEYLILEAGSG
jgi:hypothetical protein